MEIKLKGIEEFRRKLEDLEHRARALEGEYRVSFGDLLPPSFMTRHTKFATIEEMMEGSPWKVESREDLAAIPDEEWDRFIRESTQFASWEEMLRSAIGEYTAGKLGLR